MTITDTGIDDKTVVNSDNTPVVNSDKEHDYKTDVNTNTDNINVKTAEGDDDDDDDDNYEPDDEDDDEDYEPDDDEDDEDYEPGEEGAMGPLILLLSGRRGGGELPFKNENAGSTPRKSKRTLENTSELVIKTKKIKHSYSGMNKKYFESLSEEKQKTLLQLENKLSEYDNNQVPLRFKILESEMNMSTKADIIKLIDNSMSGYSGDRKKVENYVESISKMPLGRYKALPVTHESPKEDIITFLKDSKQKLDNVVFGHTEAKDKIIKLLAQWISNPSSSGLVFGIEGPMGCGKTTLVKDGVCKVLGLPFGFVPLGGISDGSFLIGHSYTYEGSKCGKVCDVLKESKYMNPILYFDELDKVSNTSHGEEIINILIHLTDSSQSDTFHDKYFSNIPIDLSRCMIIFSFNDVSMINPILRDRMTIINTKEYTTENKIKIAQDYMIPSVLKQFGIKQGDVVMSDVVIKHIISSISDEKGVRNLKRALIDIVGAINYNRIMGEETYEFPYEVKKDYVDTLLKAKTKKEDHFLHSLYI